MSKKSDRKKTNLRSKWIDEDFHVDFELRSMRLDMKNIKSWKNLHSNLIFEYAVLAFEIERKFD
jgi:hypothetical protein